jgi:hypothetical protein
LKKVPKKEASSASSSRESRLLDCGVLNDAMDTFSHDINLKSFFYFKIIFVMLIN